MNRDEPAAEKPAEINERMRRIPIGRGSLTRRTRVLLVVLPLLAVAIVLYGLRRLVSASPLVPDGMVRIPSGEFWMGSDNPMFKDARPWHRVYLDAFWIDKTLVTNQQFAQFVKATGYVTSRSEHLRQKSFPTLPKKIWWRVRWFLRRPTILFR